MSKIIFFDELTKEAKKYAQCLETMKSAIEEKKPLFKKQNTRGAISDFQKLIPELKMVVDAMENNRYFPSGPKIASTYLDQSTEPKTVLEFSFNSDYSIELQNFWWSPTSSVHTVMFGEVNEPIYIQQDDLDIKSEKKI